MAYDDVFVDIVKLSKSHLWDIFTSGDVLLVHAVEVLVKTLPINPSRNCEVDLSPSTAESSSLSSEMSQS